MSEESISTQFCLRLKRAMFLANAGLGDEGLLSTALSETTRMPLSIRLAYISGYRRSTVYNEHCPRNNVNLQMQVTGQFPVPGTR